MYKLAVLSLITACSYDPVEAEPDSGTEVDARITVDAPLDTPVDSPTSCVGSAPFSTPIEVFPADVSQIEVASLTPDGLTLAMSRNADVYVSSRATLTSPWTAPTLVTELSSASVERRPTFDTSGLTAVFVRAVTAGDEDLMLASRTSISQPWSTPVPATSLNVAPADDGDPFLSDDGLELWFASARMGRYRIYRSSRPNFATAFSAPVEVTELTSTGDENAMPTLSRDRLHIYIDSNRTGSLGSLDIFVASRASLAGTFSPPVNVTAVNSSSNDRVVGTSPDECELYLVSLRSGTLRLYVAKRSPQ